MKSDCSQMFDKPKHTLEENSRCFVLLNEGRKAFTVVRVDGCAITDVERCDYLVLVENEELFVELKGCDVPKAISQLTSSHERLHNSDYSTHWFVVSSRSPLSSTQIQAQSIRIRKRFGAILLVKNHSIEHRIS